MPTGFKNGALLVDDAATSRTNLGCGTAATQNTTTFLQTANNLSDVVTSTALTNLTVTGKHDVLISLGSVYPALTNGITLAQMQSSSNLNNYRGWSYPSGVAGVAHLLLPMPKSWNGSSLTIRPYFVTSAITGNVMWQFQTSVRNAGDPFDNTFSSANNLVVGVNATANNLIIGTETSLTLGGSTPSFPSLVEFRIIRAGNNISDTATQSALLVALLLSITTNAGNDA